MLEINFKDSTNDLINILLKIMVLFIFRANAYARNKGGSTNCIMPVVVSKCVLNLSYYFAYRLCLRGIGGKL